MSRSLTCFRADSGGIWALDGRDAPALSCAGRTGGLSESPRHLYAPDCFLSTATGQSRVRNAREEGARGVPLAPAA